ncbi:MAG: hypothetical protein H0U74_14890 [Bradymonadaceae bacterium]|nr:hypothetical protein [Lujinxingiaceae bacterium]
MICATFQRCPRVALFAAMMFAFAAASFASSPDAQARPGTHLEITFERLTITQEPGQIVVDYVIRADDWRRLQRAELAPRLDLFLARGSHGNHEVRHSGQSVQRAQGRLVYRGASVHHHQDTVGLQLLGAHKATRIDRISFGELCGSKIAVAIAHRRPRADRSPPKARPAPAPAPAPRAARPRRGPRIDEHSPPAPACTGRADVDCPIACPQSASRTDMIRACQANTRFASDFDACLVRGQRLASHQAVSTINACGQHSAFGSDMTRCLDIATGMRHNPAPVVQACGEATRFASDMHACMVTSS